MKSFAKGLYGNFCVCELSGGTHEGNARSEIEGVNPVHDTKPRGIMHD